MTKSTVFPPMLIVAVALLFGCGGGGSSGPSATAGGVTLTITPSLGQFSQGSVVRVKDYLGNLVGSGGIGANGTASITLLARTMPPLLIEVGMNGDSFFDEKLGRYTAITGLAPDGAAIRAAVPDLSRTNTGVTAITEIAVGLMENAFLDATFVSTTNQMIGTRFSISDPLAPPTIVGPNTLTLNPTVPGGSDEYALKLAALANLAKPGQNALDVTQLLRDDMADGLFDGMATKTFDYFGNGVKEAFYKPTSITNTGFTGYADVTEIKTALQNAIDIAQAKYASTSPRIFFNLPPVCDPNKWQLMFIPTNLSYQTLQMIMPNATVSDPSNPNIIYSTQGGSVGNISKSTDGGITWSVYSFPPFLNSLDTHFIGPTQMIVIDPRNTARILALARYQTSGTTYTFESRDWGVTWKSAGGNDWDSVAFAPSNVKALRDVYGFRNIKIPKAIGFGGTSHFSHYSHPVDPTYTSSSTINKSPVSDNGGIGQTYEAIYGFAIDPQQTINPKLYLVTNSFKVLAITPGCAANN